MKSRIAELEGSLALSSEQSTALRRSCLAQTEKVETVRREAEQWRGEAAQMAARLAESQASLGEVTADVLGGNMTCFFVKVRRTGRWPLFLRLNPLGGKSFAGWLTGGS